MDFHTFYFVWINKFIKMKINNKIQKLKFILYFKYVLCYVKKVLQSRMNVKLVISGI